MFDYDSIVIGSGPAGLTAALYLARGNRSVLVVSEKIYDAQVGLLELIENYPGFPDGISGAELIDNMVNQAANYDVEFETEKVTALETVPDGFRVCCRDGGRYTARVVVAASGSYRRELGVPGEKKLTGHGVFQCAFCDGGKFAKQPVAVIGGGDSGITEALYLARIASHVSVFEMLPKLGASAVLCDRAGAEARLETRCGVSVQEILGEGNVAGLRILNESGQTEDVEVSGVLVSIGHIPNTDYLAGIAELTNSGHVAVNEQLMTSREGIFAAGDIRTYSPGQISSAVGDGATAGISAERYLQRTGA